MHIKDYLIKHDMGIIKKNKSKVVIICIILFFNFLVYIEQVQVNTNK